jgi:hypothetical protein
MAVPKDLKFNPSEPDKNNEYIFIDISPLKVGTPYKFQFQWIFEDQKLNDLVGDNWSATYEYLSKSAAGPTPVTNLTAVWGGEQGDNLSITFNHDTTLNNGTNNNTGVDSYLIKLKHVGANAPVNAEDKYFELRAFDKSKTQKEWILTRDENASKFVFADQFEITVIAIDSLNKTQSTPVTITSPLYQSSLLNQTITVTPIRGGYRVAFVNDPAILFVEVWENLTIDSPDVGWYRVSQVSGKTNPIDQYVLTTQSRSVRIRVYDRNNKFKESNAVDNIVPLSLDPTDENPPGVPSVNVASTTSTTITVNIVNADASAKAHRLRFKESGATLYQTDIVPRTGSTTSYTFGDLKPNTVYNISAASYDNLNNLSAFSSDVNGTTQTLVVNPPTSVTLSATAAGVVGSWVAPATQPARVDRYKIELWKDDTVDSLITTEFSFSTSMSFGGLAAGLYYIKVQAQDIYLGLSTAVQSSSVSVIGVNQTDGLVPLSSPTAVVNPLYGALEVKWTGLTVGPRSTTANPDPVTYEVHVSTTNNFTPSASTLALQVDGTFAILKTLPGTSTALTYGTTYYVKLLSKDADGPATSYGTQGSGAPSAINNGDIAADAIRANVILANQITATQINSDALLSNKIITVGARSAVVTAASVSGSNITYTTSGTHGFGNATLVSVTGLSTAAFNVTNFAIQSTTTNTFVVLVGGSGATGSLASQSGVATSTVNTAIKIDASGTGLSASPFKLYSGTGTYADAGTTPGTPFYLDTNGRFSLRDRLFFDGSSLTVNGAINAASGNFSGNMTVNNGTMRLGAAVNGATNHGIFINANNFWYNSGNFSVGSSGNTVTWNGTTLAVTGEINAASGTITGNLTMTGGGSVIARTVGGSTNRVTLSHAGLFAYDNAGTETTKIISDAATGAPTFYTTRALIGTFSVNATTISTTGLTINSSGAVGGTQILANSGSYYVGIKPGATPSAITLWSGLSADGAGAAFRVTADGTLTANNAILTGGQLKVTGTSTMIFGREAGGPTLHGMYIGNSQDYIYDSGNFRFGRGALLYNGTNLNISNPTGGTTTISGANLVLADAGGGDDGTAGDPTVTRIINTQTVGGIPDGKIVIGRAIWYGGSTTPNSSITSRFAFNDANPASTQGFVNGQPRYTASNPGNFSTGDLYMSLV